MKKYYLWTLTLAIIMAMGSVTKIQAKETNDYLESFDGLSTSKHDFAPAGWGHIVDYMKYEGYGWGSDVYVSYSAQSSGGQSGAYLKAGSQTLYDDDYNNKTAYDLLVTPAVRGTIKFYVKNSSNSTGKLNLYKCTKSGDKFEKGEEITLSPTITLSSQWQEVTLSLTENTFIGIRLDNASIDEFSAAIADLPEIRSMEIVTGTTTLPGSILMDESGKVILKANITFKNTGNVTLNPGDAGYSFTFVNSSNKALVSEDTPSYIPNFSLAPGATSEEIEIQQEYTTAAYTPIRIRENLTNSYKHIGWVDIIPYIAKLNIRYNNNDISKPINFEVFRGTRSIEITLKNTGAAPLNITSVDLPEGYSLTTIVTFPYTIPAQETVNETITLSGDNGTKGGDLKFNFTGEGDNTIPMTGTIIGTDTWWEDFENDIPANWILPTGTNWSSTSRPSDSSMIYATQSNKNCAGNGNQDFSSFISPKITFTENKAFTFFAARRGTNSGMEIYYSPDRINWTLAKKITVANEDKTCEFATTNGVFKAFTLDNIPAGDYYLDFRAGYAYLDDVFGGKLAKTDHDFYLVSSKTDATGMVNYKVSASVTVKNMAIQTEVANTYSVILYEDNKEVAQTEGVELAAYASHDFTLSYTPHTVGTHQLVTKIKLMDSGTAFKLSESEITINPEVAATENIIGEIKSSGGNVPLSLGYKNSITETIYKSDILNLGSFASIIKIAYPYYSTSDDITTHVKIWLENTTDETPDKAAPKDTTAMTKVFDSDYNFILGGKSTEMLLTEFTLQSVFEYTGNNLRIVIQSTADSYKSYNFGYDTVITGTTIYKRSDSPSSFTTNNMSDYSGGTPVIYIYTSKAVPAVSGTVKEKTSGAILAGAQVTLTAGDIIYNATANAEGVYSMDIFQANKSYNMTVNELGFADYAKTLDIAEVNLTENIELDFNAIEGAKVVGTNTIASLTNEPLLALVGQWNADKLAELSTKLGSSTAITGIYMNAINVPADAATTAFDAINPNALVYVKEDATVPAEWKNVVKGDKATEIVLKDGTAFAPAMSFNADKISYTRTDANAKETVCLPFAVSTIPDGYTVKSFDAHQGTKLAFAANESMEANVPYLIEQTAKASMSFEATDVAITAEQPGTVEKEGYKFTGTFAPIDNAAATYHVFNGTEFLNTIVSVAAFEGYFIGGGEGALTLDGAIGIDQVAENGMRIYSPAAGMILISTDGAQNVNIYSVEGSLIRTTELNEGDNLINGLSQGIYLINNQKVVVR